MSGLAVLLTTAAIVAAPNGLAASETDLSKVSRYSLIARLRTEGPVAASSSVESNIRHSYDVTVEEILRRGDIEFVPLLIALANDESEVKTGSGGFMSLCGYDSPILLKYKVRYVLRRLLAPEDFEKMFGTGLDPILSTSTAMQYYSENTELIASRMYRGGMAVTVIPSSPATR